MLPLPYTEDEIEDRKEREMHDARYDAKEIPIKQAQEERMKLPKTLQDTTQNHNTKYPKLSIHELETINFVKLIGIEIGGMCDKIEKMHDIDKRWLAIGKTNLQQGLMAITRSIAKPETF